MNERYGKNSLKAALHHQPIIFEATPPFGRPSQERLAEVAGNMADRLKSVGRIDAVNVPEIVEENHRGHPYYKNGDIRNFAKMLGDNTRTEVIANKIVAYIAMQELKIHLEESVGVGIRNVTLVGPQTSLRSYPGPSVIDANRVAKSILAEHNGLVGNIAIGQRNSEAERMLRKTAAGASFFTTQMIFEDEIHASTLIEYARLCEEAHIKPATVFLSFAPLVSHEDLEFYLWLGVEISEHTAAKILNKDGKTPEVKSIEHAVSIWDSASKTLSKAGKHVPLGINVEQVRQPTLSASIEMLRTLTELIRDHSEVRLSPETGR